MDLVELIVEVEFSEEVSDATKFTVAQQLAELLDEALLDGSFEVPDGAIEDIKVAFDPELHF
jgi:hypothetical protein